MEPPVETNVLDIKLLSRFLQTHFHSICPADIIKVDVEFAVPKGGNYASDIYKVKIQSLLESGKRKTFSMIVKTELHSEVARENISAFPVFRYEIKNYTTTLSLMEDLQEEIGDRREKLWADIYGYEPYRMIAFEDLTDKEFIVADRRKNLDLNHALLVLRNLGRFHAMSKVLMSRGLISEADGGKYAFFAKEDFMKNWWTGVLVALRQSMINVWGPEWKDIAEKIKKYQEQGVVDRLIQLGEDHDKKFDVMNHGDTWTCNMMFRYMEFENTPIAMRLLDFQICHVNSFIWDVEQFVSMSVHYSVRRKHKEKLLEAYHESLEKNLKLFKFEGYIPTVNDVKSESKRIEFAQLWFIAVSPLGNAECEKALDMEECKSGGTPERIIDESVYSDGKALQSIGEDLKRFASSGVL